MSLLQFSLRHLLVAVAFVAIACVALLNANPWWVRGTWLAAVGLSFVAVLQAIFRRGERRAFWLGFAIAGWLCIVAGSDWFPGLRISRQLPQQILGFLYSRLPESIRLPTIEEPTGRSANGSLVFPPSTDDYASQDPRVTTGLVWLAQQQQPATAPNLRHVGFEYFEATGEALWTLLMALLGGLVARWIYRSEAARPAPAS